MYSLFCSVATILKKIKILDISFNLNQIKPGKIFKTLNGTACPKMKPLNFYLIEQIIV